MNTISLNHESIVYGMRNARNLVKGDQSGIRLLFSPENLSDHNLDEVCKLYARLQDQKFDTVVLIDSKPGSAQIKLPMPSFKFLDTSLGRVWADDKLRNDFADEDDDFFVNDDAFENREDFMQKLIMLQSSLSDFKVLNIQITDENSSIVKELAFALEEILSTKNSLIICSCELTGGAKEEIEKILQYITTDNISALMNHLNGDQTKIIGIGTFIAGLLVAKKWGLELEFPQLEETKSDEDRVILGLAKVYNQTSFQ